MNLKARRGFLAAGAALVVAPLGARAQRAARIPRVGFISSTAAGRRDEVFVQALQELGQVDGRTVHLELRFAEGRPERFPILVEELLRLNVEVLVVGSTIGARAAKKATTTIPIVFAGSSDPVAGGLVANLARPEGNITGFSLAYGDGFAGKWLELLREAAPNLTRFSALWSSSNAAAAGFVKALEGAAGAMQVSLDVHHAANLAELDEALAAIGSHRAHGLVLARPVARADQLVE